MSRLILFNKPYGVLTQFTDRAGRPTLKDYVAVPGVHPVGRLDLDSEGLLLTDDGALTRRLADPASRTWKTYWVQVEGEPAEAAQARRGLRFRHGPRRWTAVPEHTPMAARA
jgi:23S rRNA pseudouridine2457 synthase